MLKYIKTDLRRSLVSVPFLCSVLLMVFMYLVSPCPFSMTARPDAYTVVGAIFKGKELWETSGEYAAPLIFSVFNSYRWFQIVLPLIASLPSVIPYCDECESGYKRFYIVRTDRKGYAISKVVSAWVSAVLSAVISLLIFAALVYIVFPGVSHYPGLFDSPESDGYLYKVSQMFIADADSAGGRALIALAYVSGFTISCGLYSLLSLCIAALIENKFLSLCIPVILFYFGEKLVNLFDMYQIRHGIELPVFLRLFFWNKFSCVLPYYSYYLKVPLPIILLFVVVLSLLLGYVFYTIQNRRVDSGA